MIAFNLVTGICSIIGLVISAIGLIVSLQVKNRVINISKDIKQSQKGGKMSANIQIAKINDENK